MSERRRMLTWTWRADRAGAHPMMSVYCLGRPCGYYFAARGWKWREDYIQLRMANVRAKVAAILAERFAGADHE